MRVSILILTHNRPLLFKRCISSVLLNKPENVEILVNNDSKDIKEIAGATYYYKTHSDLSDTYKYLFNKASGEFIYFLEDDDYVSSDFWKILSQVKENTVFRYIPEKSIKLYYEYFIHNPSFEEHFQLGQLVFKKKSLTSFPKGNNIHNDYQLYKSLSGSIMNDRRPIYTQTTDGNDNISFDEYPETI
jgi:glycosyltransferase involved in cell wall biosynthesis